MPDAWGPAIRTPQEVPACYFTRDFDRFESYLGDGKWRRETQKPGPPWGQAKPPHKAMACFNSEGQGVAIYSPTSGDTWNFGPHGIASSDDPDGGPCVHVAPVSHVRLGPKSTYEFRYWLVVGDQKRLAADLDALRAKYSAECGKLTNPSQPKTVVHAENKPNVIIIVSGTTRRATCLPCLRQSVAQPSLPIRPATPRCLVA